MSLSTSSTIESKASGLSYVGIFKILSIILISSTLSYFIATYPIMMRMEVFNMSDLYPVDKSK